MQLAPMNHFTPSIDLSKQQPLDAPDYNLDLFQIFKKGAYITSLSANLFEIGYRVSGTPELKYAQRIGGKPRSPDVLTRYFKIQNIKTLKIIGRTTVILGVVSTTPTIIEGYNEYKETGKVKPSTVADSTVGVGATIVGVLSIFGMISNLLVGS